jgi:hypothetical protein
MKTKTSFLQLARNFSTVGLLISINKVGVEAVRTTAAVEAEADASLDALAESMQRALLDQGVESESANELHSMLRNHVRSQLDEGMFSEQSQKTNLEEQNYLHLWQDVSTRPAEAAFILE